MQQITIDRETAEALVLDLRGYQLLAKCTTVGDRSTLEPLLADIETRVAALESALAAGGGGVMESFAGSGSKDYVTCLECETFTPLQSPYRCMFCGASLIGQGARQKKEREEC